VGRACAGDLPIADALIELARDLHVASGQERTTLPEQNFSREAAAAKLQDLLNGLTRTHRRPGPLTTPFRSS
jgi:hypothetical protein